MKKLKWISALIVAVLLAGSSAFAQEPIIYPSEGQSQEQQEKDKSDCYNWAKQQTGFDPMLPPPAAASSSSEPSPKGGRVKGAARGALVGVTVGAITGDAGKGAAIGASSGALIGGMRQRDQAKAQQQAQQEAQQQADQQAAAYAQQRENYNRAYGACLEGRGYTVK